MSKSPESIQLKEMFRVQVDLLFFAKTLLLQDRHAEIEEILDNCVRLL